MRHPLRVLIVEDVEDHALLIARELEKGGFEPLYERVETLQELEAALDQRSWDAIISDFNLPDFDGLDVLRMMQDKGLDLPFLLVSGAIGEEKAAEVMRAGANDYIRKGNYARLPAVLERELRDAAVRHERRLSAEELSRHREHLEELVYERTEELVRANEALQAEIAERRRAEEALRQSEKKFSKIFHAAPALIGIATLNDATLIDINETALQVLGYRREEVIGRTTKEVGAWGDEAELRKVVETLESNLPLKNEEIGFRGKSGHVFTGLLSAEIIELDSNRYLLLLVRDITQRKRAEEALRKSEEMLRYASLAADIGMWHYDLINEELLWSDRCKELFDYPTDQPMSYRAFLDAIVEEDRPRIHDSVQKALKERADYSEEMRVRLQDGRIRWVLSKGHAFYDEQGKPVRMDGIAFDITERKQAEVEIARLNADLANHLAQLEERNEELDAFNRMISHDLRQPLNVMALACQEVHMLCGNDEKSCQKGMTTLRSSVTRMNGMIDTLLKFSRSTHGDLVRQSFDISEMARTVVVELRLAEPQRQVVCKIAEGITAYGDPQLLRAALENLIGNAWKYTGTREEGVIEFGAREIDGKPVYFVSDNGKGFDMADADRIFIPFQRLAQADGFTGSGIGLATVQRIIQRHGGRIWVETEPEKGATFYFTLGVAAAK